MGTTDIGNKRCFTSIFLLVKKLEYVHIRYPKSIYTMNLKFIGLKKLFAEEMSPKRIKTVIRDNQILLSNEVKTDLFSNKWDNKKNKININGRSSKLIPNIPKPKLGSIKVEEAIRNPTININLSEFNIFFAKWARQDSNLRPTDYESVALTNWATGPSSRKELYPP